MILIKPKNEASPSTEGRGIRFAAVVIKTGTATLPLRSIKILKEAVSKARLGYYEKLHALRRLSA